MDKRNICRVNTLLPGDIEVMDEDPRQNLREKPRPSATLSDSDDEAELLRLQASQSCQLNCIKRLRVVLWSFWSVFR